MELALSYFYQLRFFQPNMVPFSTAVWDPKWFQKGKDRRGIYTGIRVEPLVPGPTCKGLCRGPATCANAPSDCEFLLNYRSQLETVNCDHIMSYLRSVTSAVRLAERFVEEPVAVLMVYEAPDKLCSERAALLEWFRSNGHYIEEWKREDPPPPGKYEL